MSFIQKIIDILRHKYPSSSSYKEVWFKKCGLENHLSETATLILGSSHGVYAYIPKTTEFNLCLVSQDLYYSFKLYEKYAKKLKSLKNIVLFYSVFSSGFDMSKTSENYRTTHYWRAFNIEPKDTKLLPIINKEIKEFENKIKKIENQNYPNINYLGENLDVNGKRVGKQSDKYDLKKRTASHLKNNTRPISQLQYLRDLINLASANNVNVTVVISPAHEKYKNYLPNSEILFKDLYKLNKETVFKILNFYDETFIDDYWYDYDHLNTNNEGAKILTNQIRECLNKNSFK